MADFLYPATDEEIDIGNSKTIKLSDENYIARLKQFIKLNMSSNSFKRVIGSNLEFIGDRIDQFTNQQQKDHMPRLNKKKLRVTLCILTCLLEIF